MLKQNQPAAQDTPTESISVTPRTPPSVETKPPKSKKGLVKGIAGLAVVAALAFVGYQMFGGDGTTDLSAPVPLGPADGTTITDTRQPTAIWRNESADANVVFEYADNADFTNSRTRANIQDTTFTFRVELENGTYFWRLWALGPEGRVGPSATHSFTIALAPDTGPETPGSGQLVLDVSPSADRITINDTLVFEDRSDLETDLPAGRHVISVSNETSRQKRYVDTLTITAGKTTSKNYRFTFPPPPDDTPAFGEIRVGSTPRGAQIYINDELQRQKTNFAFRLPPGSHTIRATIDVNGELKELSRTVTLQPEQIQRLSFDFEAEKAYLNP